MEVGFSRPTRIKRADQIVEEVKRWIVGNRKRPGDRLPPEKELMELFACSKGTIREALKSLEVQGLVSVRTGPRGGAVLASVPLDTAMQLLRNYLHFQHPTGAQIYALRKQLEPVLAVRVCGRLSVEQLERLDALVHQCEATPADFEERRAHRIAELEFHNVLAEACDDPLLSFICRFINDLIRDLVIYKKVLLPEQVEFSRSNLEHHRALIAAYRREDATAVGDIMTRHMAAAERFNLELDGQLDETFLIEASLDRRRKAPPQGGA